MLTIAGCSASPHIPGAKPLLGDTTHYPARLQDPQDAEEEDEAGRR